MSRPARQAREAGTAQDLFQRQRTQQKKAKHADRPRGASNTIQRSGTGGGAGPRRLSGPGEAVAKVGRMAGRASRCRSPARRAPDRPRGARPGPATRSAPEEQSSATNHPFRVKETKQRHNSARARRTKQRHKPPSTRQRNQAAPQPVPRQKNKATPQTTQYASKKPSSATTRHTPEEQSSATNHPSRVKETRQRHNLPDMRQRNQAVRRMPCHTKHPSHLHRKNPQQGPRHHRIPQKLPDRHISHTAPERQTQPARHRA